jgi:hypothetical protein
LTLLNICYESIRYTALSWIGRYHNKKYIEKAVSLLPENKIRKINKIITEWKNKGEDDVEDNDEE